MGLTCDSSKPKDWNSNYYTSAIRLYDSVLADCLVTAVTRNLNDTEAESLSEKGEPERREKFITFTNRKFPVHAKSREKSCARRKHFLLAGDSDWIGGTPKQPVEQDQDPAHQDKGKTRTVFVTRKEKDSHLI